MSLFFMFNTRTFYKIFNNMDKNNFYIKTLSNFIVF